MTRERFITGANWIMVMAASCWCIFAFTGMFASPQISTAAWMQGVVINTPKPAATPAAAGNALPASGPTAGAEGAIAGPGSPALPSANQSLISTSGPPENRQAGPPGAPTAVAPPVPIPLLNPHLLDPRVGKDF